MRLRSHVLPTVAMEGACLFLVILSFILPSPDTFTVNGLPVWEGPIRNHQEMKPKMTEHF